ncbi:hypothetical protein PG994_002147 [Apiospora phragmitis]|uniref:DUF382 domain-containing protein n=1 Tax=Apiospora phragmitis TaxID=2905665 RepID=A0ABR1WVI3_9PEZI
MAPQMTKNQKRRAKKKAEKASKPEETAQVEKSPEAQQDGAAPESEKPAENGETTNGTSELEVKKDDATAAKSQQPDGPVVEEFDFDNEDPAFAMYKHVFTKFGVSEDDDIAKEANAGNTGEVFFDNDDDIPEEEEEGANSNKMSKKKRKMLNKLSIAELKALVKKPEVVEWHDTSSTDPRLLVQIKAQRNVVPVPPHWSLKREYLSSKRGIEKAAFKLPKFIADTGITEMRDAVLEKQAEQTLKQKQRERVQPKMGKLDIDYQKLYDAFFRFQEKPNLTRFGEVYYEGKEFETKGSHARPAHSVGELQPPEEESEEEEDEDEEDEDDDEDAVGAGLQTPSGIETSAGLASSVPTEYGTQTESVAGEMDLRKNRRGYETEESTHPRSAYTVIPERQARAEGFFGSDRAYDLSKSNAHGDMRVLGQDDDRGQKRKKPGDIDVALDPEALAEGGLGKDELRRRYEEGRRDEGPGAQWRREEGLNEMIANESRKRLKRDEEKRDERKKYKF